MAHPGTPGLQGPLQGRRGRRSRGPGEHCGGWSPTLGEIHGAESLMPPPSALPSPGKDRDREREKETCFSRDTLRQSFSPWGITGEVEVCGSGGSAWDSEMDRQRGHGVERKSFMDKSGGLPGGEKEGGSEVRGGPVRQRPLASLLGSHGNGVGPGPQKGWCALGKKSGVTFTHHILSCSQDDQKRQALLQRFPRRPLERLQAPWKDHTESCDYVRVSVPGVPSPFVLGVT